MLWGEGGENAKKLSYNCQDINLNYRYLGHACILLRQILRKYSFFLRLLKAKTLYSCGR